MRNGGETVYRSLTFLRKFKYKIAGFNNSSQAVRHCLRHCYIVDSDYIVYNYIANGI